MKASTDWLNGIERAHVYTPVPQALKQETNSIKFNELVSDTSILSYQYIHLLHRFICSDIYTTLDLSGS